MKKTKQILTTIFVFLVLTPIVFSFSGSSTNYKTTANIGLALVEEQNTSNYKTKAVIINQPIGIRQNSNYELRLGPYYLLGKEGIELFYLVLAPNWNPVSIPLIPTNNSITEIMSNCTYKRIWKFNTDQSWISTETGLTEMNIYDGYWVDRSGLIGNCNIAIEGELPSSTTINVSSGWALVGYPSLTTKEIPTLINSSLYNRIWEFQPDQSWSSTDTGLTNMTPGRGYWIDGSASGSYEVVN